MRQRATRGATAPRVAGGSRPERSGASDPGGAWRERLRKRFRLSGSAGYGDHTPGLPRTPGAGPSQTLEYRKSIRKLTFGKATKERAIPLSGMEVRDTEKLPNRKQREPAPAPEPPPRPRRLFRPETRTRPLYVKSAARRTQLASGSRVIDAGRNDRRRLADWI